MTIAWIIFFFKFSYQIYIAIATFIFYISLQQIYGGIEMFMSLQLKQQTINHKNIIEPEIKHSIIKKFDNNKLGIIFFLNELKFFFY